MNSPGTLPEGWETKPLGDIFTAPQLEKLKELSNTSTSLNDLTQKLRSQFQEPAWSKTLEAKGFYPAYAAYAVAYAIYTTKQ